MTDREIDMIYENESARMWEEQNTRDEEWDKKLDSVEYLNVAIEHLGRAAHSLNHARDQLEGISAEYRLESLVDSFEELLCDIKILRDKFIKGEG